MLLVDIFNIILRLTELAFATIVAVLTGVYLHSVQDSSSWELGRFIFTEVVAGLSILVALFWACPIADSFLNWPYDGLLSMSWFVAFGLVADWLSGSCANDFKWTGIGIDVNNTCPQWRANIAFLFLSAVCWLSSTVLGMYWVQSQEDRIDPASTAASRRRRWYRARV